MSTWLTNVLLETGEAVEDDGRVQTTTKLHHIEISDEGIIQNMILANEEQLLGQSQIDIKGKLALPPFKEMHNHLDKTYLSIGWQACKPVRNLTERLAYEAEELASLAETVEQRAKAMIELHLENGVNHIRTHVNIDPFIGLKNLEGVKKALQQYETYLTYDIVAFPQHGILAHEEMPKLLAQALENGATILGALDPAGIDKNVEQSLQITMDLAKQYEVDVDMHLHDREYVGYYTMDKWLNMIKAQQFNGKTAFSHAFGLSGIPVALQQSFAEKLQAFDIAIMSTVPISIHHTVIPIDMLQEKDVPVYLGCDGFYDSWSPFFSGDIVEKVNHFCDYTSKSDERSLRQSLKLITNGLTPLNQQGEQCWPQVGDEASFVFINTSCSAEAIARVPKERQLMHKGKLYVKKK